MFIHQKDILWEMDRGFVSKIMKLAVKETHEKGEVLFREGEPAKNMYMLTKGHVRLSIGEMGHTVYMVNHGGESFGWSSIIGRETYTATAECVERSQMYRIEGAALQQLLEANPEIAMSFYKKIAAALGDRLLHFQGRNLPPSSVTTFGNSRVQDYPEAL